MTRQTVYLNAAYLLGVVVLFVALNGFVGLAPGLDFIFTFWGWATIVFIAVQLLVFTGFRRLRVASAAAAVLSLLVYAGPAVRDAWLNGGPKGGAAHMPVQVTAYNMDGINYRDWAPLVNYLEALHPDILVLSEVPYSFGPQTKALRQAYPYWSSVSGSDILGDSDLLVLSRWPLTSQKVVLARAGQARFYVVKTQVHLSDATLNLYGVHAPTMSIASYAAQRANYFDSLSSMVGGNGPAVMAGDFNATRWDPALAPVLDRSYFHSQPMVRYPLTRVVKRTPFFEVGARIDQVFASRGVKVEKCHVGPTFGSDHNLLACEIRY